MYVTNPPASSELGAWTDVLTPVQRAVWDKMRDAKMSDWPGNSFGEIKAIGISWDLGICGDLLMEAIACWVCHHVHEHQVPAYLKDWLEGREELAG